MDGLSAEVPQFSDQVAAKWKTVEGETRAYYVQDVDMSGKVTQHGPIFWNNVKNVVSGSSVADWSVR